MQDTLLLLEQYRKSPNRGAGASRPKRVYSSPRGEIYFKFGMTNNEMCAELFSYALAHTLGIPVAEAHLAQSGMVLGIASHDIGWYQEPDDRVSYSVKDFLHLENFIEMCLFDYLIMNEDRHAGNWGIITNRVAPLFDHNYAFGGDVLILDADGFMENVTSSFYVTDENKQRHDTLLKYFVKYHVVDVVGFMERLERVRPIANHVWEAHFPQECRHMNILINKRIDYMRGKVAEYAGRQIDDNEF